MDDINKNFGDIRAHVRTPASQSTIKYIEVSDKYSLDDLISVGVYCNNEYPTTAKYLNPFQYWTFSDTFNQSYLNAGTIINDFCWQEENKLRSLKRIPGLYVNQINSYKNGYNAQDVNIFNNSNQTGTVMENFNAQNLSTSSAIELFGYFIPDVTGPWTFTIPAYSSQNVYSKLWINSDYAVFDYMNKNADLCNDKDREDTNIFTGANSKPPTSTITLQLTKGDIVSLRMHVITTSRFSGSMSNFLSATGPDGVTKITTNNDLNKYFVTITEDGRTPYYKKSKYFALVLDPANKSDDNTKQKYFCWFMDTTPANCATITALKFNPMLQYIRNLFKLPITLDVTGTIVTNNTMPTDVTIPTGVNLSITDGTWGKQNYDWSEQIQVPYNVTEYVPGQVTDQTIGGNYGAISGHQNTLSTDPYNKTVQKIRVDTVRHSEPQMTNVKNKQQSLTNVNKYHVDAGTYAQQFGDPTYTGRGTGQSNPGFNQLTTSYKWTKVEEDFTNKQLYINPQGALMLDYLYGGVNYSSPINISYTPNKWDTNQGPCPYKLTLEASDNNNRATLVIRNNGALVASLDVYNQKDPFTKVTNESWKQHNLIEFAVGQRLIEGQNALGSKNGQGQPDGFFKFSLETVNATLMYSVDPYIPVTIQNDKPKFGVTTPFNQENSKQMLYLYRIRSRGLIGKKFLSERNDNLGTKDVYYVPNSNNNMLQHRDFSDKDGYPILTPDYNKDNYVFYDTNQKTKEQCQSECMISNKCDHYFYVYGAGSSTVGKCYIDNTNNANSIYTTQNTNTTMSGKGVYSVKNDRIISSCEYNNGDSLVNREDHSKVMDRTVYYQPVANQPELTYYCGLARHQQAVQNIKNDYEKREGFSTIGPQLAPTVFEPFNANCSNLSCMNANIDSLSPAVQSYSKTQDKISLTYNTTQDRLKRHDDLSDNLADPKYKYNDTNALIPGQFINDPNPQPDTNIIQGQITDMKQNLLVQNTIFTLAAISAASFVIIAMAIGRS